MRSEHLLCYYCGEIYDEEYVRADPEYLDGMDYHCPKLSCGGKLIPCDELIMPTVYVLNRTGYPTHDSCSGHYGGRISDTYISFSCLPEVLEEVIEKIVYFRAIVYFRDDADYMKLGYIRFTADIYVAPHESKMPYTDKVNMAFNYITDTDNEGGDTEGERLSEKSRNLLRDASKIATDENSDLWVVIRPLIDGRNCIPGTEIKRFSITEPSILVKINAALWEMVKSFPIMNEIID